MLNGMYIARRASYNGIIVLLVLILLASCAQTGTGVALKQYDNPGMWYVDDRDADIDLFYVVSTNVMSGVVDNTDTHMALLTPEDRALMKKEFQFVSRKMDGVVNVYAPYYHQFTMSSLSMPEDEFTTLSSEVADEVNEAFCNYIATKSGGRRFVLMGFSQGAQHVLHLLRSMDDATYDRCIAAYVLGYKVTAEDLEHPYINAAKGCDDTGVTVSFNSVADTTAVWDEVTSDAAICINPVNWQTDTTPATTLIDGVEACVRVDTVKNVLLVEGLQPEKYFIKALEGQCPVGNYHLGDLIFYMNNLKENILRRAASAGTMH